MIENEIECDFFPIRECFAFATGWFGIRPESFWQLGLAELFAYVDGIRKHSCASFIHEKAPTRDELNVLLRKLEN